MMSCLESENGEKLSPCLFSTPVLDVLKRWSSKELGKKQNDDFLKNQ